jgi:hypothetical protein
MEAMARERSASQLVRDNVPDVELLPADSEATTWGAIAIARAGLTSRREHGKEGSRSDELP